MSSNTKVCLVGQVLVDVSFLGDNKEPKLRFGGIFHAARALWAMDCPYILAYVAPEYMDKDIVKYAKHHGAVTTYKIGNVLGCPNVVTISEVTEAGPRKYDFLLRDEQECIMDFRIIKKACKDNISDVLIFPGGYEVDDVFDILKPSRIDVHIDINFQPENPKDLARLGRHFATVILSTSSKTFLHHYSGSSANFCNDVLGKYCETVLLKENRGGSRFFQASNPELPLKIPAQVRNVQHSVGVGDCFNAIYVYSRHNMDERTALSYASCVAAEYACTTYPDDFKNAAQATLKIPADEIVRLKGVSLPWEDRPKCHIYIAVPDFDYIDRRPLEKVLKCLEYHNFTPRRPVIEHGLMGIDADFERKQMLCEADVKLMDECKIMLAVLLSDDPGTLIEIGMGVERKMPVIVYDPYNRATNLMLTQLPNLVSSDLDQIITAVFKYAS